MTDKQVEHRAKKTKLIKLSQEAKAIQGFEIETGTDDRNINTILIEDFYTDLENQIFKTFHDWKKENKLVKKGEKAFLVWGSKRKNNQDKPEEKEPTTEDQAYSFYPICCLFSNAQVH